MQPIIYDVHVSADGFIDGPPSDISKFPIEGPAAEDYFERLKGYRCAIMGRATYEFGYAYGLNPGANPYPHMKTLVFSRTIDLEPDADVEIARENSMQRIESLRRTAAGPIYLCGGGKFSGWLLSAGMIDRLHLKRAPIILGTGTPLFGDYTEGADVHLEMSKLYDDGVVYQEFTMNAL